MTDKLAGKVALVTGGSAGIGATALLGRLIAKGTEEPLLAFGTATRSRRVNG